MQVSPLALLTAWLFAVAAPPVHATWIAHPGIAILSARPSGPAPPQCHAYEVVFSAVGFTVRYVPGTAAGQLQDTILIVPQAEAASLTEPNVRGIVAFVQRGGRLITAGDTALSRALGLRFADLEITWRNPYTMRAFEAPDGAEILALARGTEIPLVVGFTRGHGTVMFLGVDVGDEQTQSHERFPTFLAEAERVLGVVPFLSAPRLAAYVDLGDHRGADWSTVARGWYDAGIREVHLGAWDAFDRPAETVRLLLESCHRLGIRVLAWLELPEVSEAFWRDHPEWREKTAAGDDAVVDGRRLMALDIPECLELVERGLADMFRRFDWDGVDIADLHYESAAGPESAELFTPLNDHVREVFAGLSGFDPQALFRRGSERYWRHSPASLDLFLAFRRELTVDTHEKLLSLVAGSGDPNAALETVVTLPDALAAPGLRDTLGVDPERIAALARRYPFRLQIESSSSAGGSTADLAGIAAAYRTFFPWPQPLGVEIEDSPRPAAFPTSRPTGVELVELLARAAKAFSWVSIREGTSLSALDRAWLAHALASPARVSVDGAHQLTVEAPDTVEVELGEAARRVLLDGRAWPAVRGSVAIVPRGRHRLTWRAGEAPAGHARLLDINGALLGAAEHVGRLTIRYTSFGRAFVTLSFSPRIAKLDGANVHLATWRSTTGSVVAAPSGDHTLVLVQ
jgi:hypothetical protein